MRACILLVVLVASSAHAETAGPELELGGSIGSFRFHGETMMGAGGDLALGFHAGPFALLADAQDRTLIPTSYPDSASYKRIGWRARYELVYFDERVRHGDVHFHQNVDFELGTGEEFVTWDHVDHPRPDLALGVGWAMSAHYGPHHRMGWALYLALRATFAAPVASDTTERISSTESPSSSGHDSSYMFCFGYRI